MAHQPRENECGHPDRPHCARGKCRPCYMSDWRREKKARYWRARRRPCDTCGRTYTPNREGSLYCSKVCLVVSTEITRAERRGSQDGVEYLVTRDRWLAREIVSTATGRGCRVVDRHSKNLVNGQPFVAAWHRSGGLYVVRVRWPDMVEQERAEAAA